MDWVTDLWHKKRPSQVGQELVRGQGELISITRDILGGNSACGKMSVFFSGRQRSRYKLFLRNTLEPVPRYSLPRGGKKLPLSPHQWGTNQHDPIGSGLWSRTDSG
jgi:hypothetical protein